MWSALDKIKQKSNVSFIPTNTETLRVLQNLGLPEDLLDFYREVQPADEVEINGTRMIPAEWIIMENRDAIPGADIQPFGYVVFATTKFGDVFCFATNGKLGLETAPIVFLAHDLEWAEPEMRARLPELATPVADNFSEFLELFAGERLPSTPKYPVLEP